MLFVKGLNEHSQMLKTEIKRNNVFKKCPIGGAEERIDLSKMKKVIAILEGDN